MKRSKNTRRKRDESTRPRVVHGDPFKKFIAAQKRRVTEHTIAFDSPVKFDVSFDGEYLYGERAEKLLKVAETLRQPERDGAGAPTQRTTLARIEQIAWWKARHSNLSNPAIAAKLGMRHDRFDEFYHDNRVKIEAAKQRYLAGAHLVLPTTK